MVERDASRDAVINEGLCQLKRLRYDAVAALLPFPGELAVLNPPATAGTVRRAVGRLRLVQRFADLRRVPENRSWGNRAILVQVSREAGRIAPGQRCSVRSLQTWIEAYNALTSGGLAAGWEALIDNYGRPVKRPLSGP